MFGSNGKFDGTRLLTKARPALASLALLASAFAAHAQQPGAQTATPTFTPAPSANTQQQPAQQPPADANARRATPDAQIQQSAQPAAQPSQAQSQTPTGQPPAAGQSQPDAPLRLDAVPTFDQLNTQGQPRTIQTVPAPPQPRQPGRESVPTQAPAELPLDVPPVAQGFRATPGPLPELGRVGVNMAEQRPLALREAIELALQNAKEIEVARANVRAAEFDLLGARGAYDPRLSSLSYYERISTPATSFLSGAAGALTQSNLVGTFRLEGLTPRGGGGYRFDFSSIRQTTNNQFTALNPLFPTAFTFNYTQPVLRGREFDQNRRAIEIAKKNLSLTDAQFRQRAIETITQVQRAYWDLVFALKNLQIQRDAVRDARAQYEHNKRLVAEGLLAPIDVVAAEAQVSGFEQSVYTALDEVGRAENNLKNLIAENRQAEVWNVAIVPTDTVDLATTPPVSLDTALMAALGNRPELQQSDVVAAINELDTRLAREQAKTQLDLVASYGATGVAGSLDPARATNPFSASSDAIREQVNQLTARLNGITDPDLALLPPVPQGSLPENLVGGYGQSLANLAANRYNNFRVGVQLNLPLRNRAAEAQLGRSLVERDRIRTQREQLEQLIQVDVRNALQVVRTAESRLRAASVARDASERQYASELRKFDAGQSTIFLVLERQTALATARGNELRAQTELNKAAAELQRATGNSLEANQVQVRVR
ncbi:MAG TPA: TolC family protein [Pyrinomonadaceae bacterium]|nr:TolC family protein [Pyrinomonadaceae bacterium]